MTPDEKLMQQALEALENLQGLCTDADDGWVEAVTIWTPEIIKALRERLAQPEQEPEYCNPGTELYKVAALVMSDCGHSSNNQRLLDRVARRIEKHLDAHAALVAAAEREKVAKMIEDAPKLVKFATNDKGGCLVCGFTPKLAAAAIRERKDT